MRYIAFLTILTIFSNAFGQKIEKDLYLKHSVKQDGLSYSFKVLDSDARIPRYQKGKTYFWFKTQKVISTQGGSSGALLHGLCESFYDNKQLSQKGKFYKGLKDGEWIYWRADGTILLTEQWNRGKLSGKQFLYDEKGKISETIEYKRNSNTRKTADSLIVSNENKTKQTIYTFDSIGNVKTKVQFENGAKEGKARFYEEGKLVKTEVYQKGNLVEDKKETVSGEKKKFWFFKKDKESNVQEKEPREKKKWFGKKSGSENQKPSKKKAPEKSKNQVKSKKKDKKGFFDFLRKKKTSR